MDLFVLRYADYVRTMLCSFPKQYRITLPLYQFCIAQGKNLTQEELHFRHTPFRIHWFDLIKKAESIWDVFRTEHESFFQFTENEKRDVNKSRFARFHTYMNERFELRIDDADWVADLDYEEETINETFRGTMYLDLTAYDFLQEIMKEPKSKIRSFDPLLLHRFFRTDHTLSLSTDPTDTMKKATYFPLNESGMTNKKWSKYLDEIMKIYNPEQKSAEDTDKLPDMSWDTLHRKIMTRYSTSNDRDTFVSGIVNFAITGLVKKTLRMKLKNDSWVPPKGHTTSRTIEVNRKEADSMLEFLHPSRNAPPFIGNHFFCKQLAVSKNNTVQYQKISPRKSQTALNRQFEVEEEIELNLDDSENESEEVQSEKDNGSESESESDDGEEDEENENKSTPKSSKRKKTQNSTKNQKKTKK